MNALSAIGPTIDRRTMLKGAFGLATGFLGGEAFGQPFAFLPTNEVTQQELSHPLTIGQSLHLAGQNLLAILNPEDNYLPYWQLTVTPEYEAYLSRWWPAHNIGRWLDAMYRLQEATGFEIPGNVDKAMAQNAQAFFDNPDHISLNPKPWPVNPWTKDEGLQWDLHSIREGMLALNALARWRKSDWAVEKGRQMIRSLDAKLRPDGNWDLDAFDACKKRGKAVIHNVDPCDTHGRMIEALIWFYETTGEVEALKFASRLAEFHITLTVEKGGGVVPGSRADHTHSYFGTLRGLLLYGRLTKQREFVDRVDESYRANVPRVVHESGYTSHNMVAESFGETTSPGDAAQMALWLAQEGVGDHLDDVDRIVRARLLPSQIRSTPPLKAPKDALDAHKDLEKRILGGYGGCHGHPHAAKMAVTDVTAADVHSLVDILRHITVREGDELKVLFHFDHEDANAKVVCRRANGATLLVTPKKAGLVAVRVPRWAPKESVALKVDGRLASYTMQGAFAQIGRVPAGKTVTLEYGLPVRKTEETGLGGHFELTWRGDEVTSVSPNSDFYPFYPGR